MRKLSDDPCGDRQLVGKIILRCHRVNEKMLHSSRDRKTIDKAIMMMTGGHFLTDRQNDGSPGDNNNKPRKRMMMTSCLSIIIFIFIFIKSASSTGMKTTHPVEEVMKTATGEMWPDLSEEGLSYSLSLNKVTKAMWNVPLNKWKSLQLSFSF